ncbi:MAG: GAF domain-containing protein [Chloroflexi bacterium]|nr:GAF domain-containing protein [Chloroflexota bacterium]
MLATRQPLLRELPTNFGFPIDEVYRASGLRSAITVPLIYKGHVVGTLGLRSKKPHAYSQRDIVILERLASQIAPTIENSQLAEQIKANTLRARVLSEVNKILSTSSDLETLFTNLVGYLCQEIDLDQGLLSWITFNGYDIDTIVCTPGTRATTHGSSDSSEIFRSRLTVPLAYQDQIIGSFELARSGYSFATAEQDLMHRVGRHLESAVHNMVLRHLTMRKAYRLNQRDGDAAGLASRENQDGQIERDPMNDLAHALYSPLTSIKGYTETLLQPDEDWPKEVRQEFLQTIHQAANRLDHAIRDLVIPPRRESGPTESQTRVQDLFRQFELERSSQAEVDSVHFQCDPNLPTISIDPSIFQRAIDHLIDCCISFGTGPTSAGPDHLHILAESAQDSVVISLGFSTVDAPDSTTESPIASAVETNLKTVISRNLLEEQGISLEVERPDRHSVLFRFSVPFKQTANQLP